MREAALRHTPLRVVAVCRLAGSHFGHGDANPEDAARLERARSAAQEATDKALAGLGGSRPDSVAVDVINGIPAEALVSAAAGAEMIVVGSRGAGGFKRLAMGSVADQVARHTHCPVVIIPAEDAK